MYYGVNRGNYHPCAVSIALIALCALWMAGSQAIELPQQLAIAYPGKVLLLTWDVSQKEYATTREASLEPGGYHRMAFLQGNLFVSTDSAILKFDSNLRQTDVKNFKEVMTIAADENSLFVCAEDALIAIDAELTERSRVELVVGDNGETKNAHDILLYNEFAFLLDNIMRPIFLFRVNVTDPNALKIEEKIDYQGVNTHLARQWLNPDTDDWCVVEETSIMTGYGERLVRFPMGGKMEEKAETKGWPPGIGKIGIRVDSGSKVKASQDLWWVTREGMPGGEDSEGPDGTRILATTPVPPLIALIQDKDGPTQLATIQYTDAEIGFDPKLTLPDFTAPLAVMSRYREYLILCETQPAYGRYESPPTPRLRIIRTEKTYEALHNQALDWEHNALPFDIVVMEK